MESKQKYKELKIKYNELYNKTKYYLCSNCNNIAVYELQHIEAYTDYEQFENKTLIGNRWCSKCSKYLCPGELDRPGDIGCGRYIDNRLLCRNCGNY